jgi:hypothetical protein
VNEKAKTETTKTTLIFPSSLWREVLHRAIDEDRPASAIVADALTVYLKAKPKPKPKPKGGGRGSR